MVNLMIKLSVFLNSLQKRVVFKRLNKAEANSFSKKLDSFTALFNSSGKIPEQHVKTYVRWQLSFTIGMMLFDLNQTKLILPINDGSEFCQLWNNPLQLLNKQ